MPLGERGLVESRTASAPTEVLQANLQAMWAGAHTPVLSGCFHPSRQPSETFPWFLEANLLLEPWTPVPRSQNVSSELEVSGLFFRLVLTGFWRLWEGGCRHWRGSSCKPADPEA